MASFAEQFKAAAKRIADRADRVAVQVVFDTGKSLVDKSPVGNPALWKNPAAGAPPYEPGRFKGSWHHSVGTAPTDQSSTIDPQGDSSLTEVWIGANANPIAKHYVGNNLPYAMKLEVGDHSSQVPPQGMVGTTEIEFSQIVREANAKVV